MIDHSKQQILARVLEEVRVAEASGMSAATTEHSVYVSGLFEKEGESEILSRVLAEVRSAESSDAAAITTEHSVYVSGLFDKE
jgi:hypothetical protein